MLCQSGFSRSTFKRPKLFPDGTQQIFERIFGERHFSLKCFGRSAVFSLGAMAFIGMLLFLISPQEILGTMEEVFTFRNEDPTLGYGDWLLLTLWLPWSVLVDYVGLFKTRLILRILTRKRRWNQITAIAIVGIDYIMYRLLFS
jgi:hypothetical protein